MKKKIITIILLAVFFIGLSVLLYPAISQYWNSKVQSKAVSDYETMLKNMPTTDYTKIFEEADDYNNELRALGFPLTEYKKLSGYDETVNIGNNGMIGYISIDKIQVELPIYHGTSASVLNVACGHLEGSSLPVGGAGTHAVLSAHRGLPSAKLFTHLDMLEIGDTFVIRVLDRTLTYQVDQIKTVNPNESEDLQIVDGEDYCTLLTCTPYGINTHRLLVRGKRIEIITTKDIYVKSEAYLIDKLIVTPIVALPILFVLMVYVCFKPVKKKIVVEEDEQDI